MPGIFGFSLCAEKKLKALHTDLEKTARMMGDLISEIQKIRGAVIIPPSRVKEDFRQFSPYILNVAFPPVPGEVLVR
ncbi:unnamed protein product, partial [marine sediment metagenome]